MIRSVRIYTRLRRLWMPALLATLLAAPLAAQHTRHTIIHQSDRKHKDVSAHLSSAARALPLTIDMRAFRSIAGGEIHLSAVPISRGVQVDLDLTEFHIIEPGAKLISTGINGETPLPPTTVRLYRGTVAGDETSEAFMAFGDHSILGSVKVGGKTYEISTDFEARSSAGALAAIAYPLADVQGPRSVCGINDRNSALLGSILSEEEIARMSAAAPAAEEDEILFSVKGAFEGDREYLNLFAGNKQAAEDYMIQLIGRVSAIFERDMACQIVISHMNIWEANDPYTESGSMDAALFQANGHWVQSRPNVDRHFVHIFSGKAWQNPIGIAFLDVLCVKGTATAYSAITKSNPQRDIEVVAHENGHVFGSRHTHSCTWNPEIDRCAPADDGNCFSAGQVEQGTGTIMSYCAQKELVFHEKCANLIKGYLQDKYKCVEFSRRLTIKPLVIYFKDAITGVQRDTTIEDFYRNNSKQPVNVTEQTLTGKNVASITIVEPTLPFTLAPGETRKIRVKFKSDQEDPAIVKMTVKHNGLNPPITVNIEAYAQDKLPVLGLIAGGDKEIDFRTIRVGAQLDTLLKSFIANNGDAPLRIGKTEMVGPDRYDFQVLEGTAPIEIGERGQRLDAKFRFTPKTPGQKVAWFRVESNSKFGFDSVKLTGNAKVGPLLRLRVNELSVNFKVREKGTSYDTTFEQFFLNAGSDDLQVIADLEGPDAEVFTAQVNAFDLAPGETYPLKVDLFSPTDGLKKAYLVVNQIELEDNTIYRRDTIWLIANVGNVSASTPGAPAEIEGFSVAPNPTAGDATLVIAPLKGEAGALYTLTVTDVAGREVYRTTGRFTADESRLPFDTDALAAGVYYLRLQSEKSQRMQTLTITR